MNQSDVPTLGRPDLAPLWTAIVARLEARGTEWRGRVRVSLVPSARQVVTHLVDDPRAMLDLTVLEAKLVSLGVGTDLADALARLDYPVSPDPARRRAKRAAAALAREAAAAEAATWPEPWPVEWLDEVWRRRLLSDIDAVGAAAFVSSCRRVLNAVATHQIDGTPTSRTELAARVLGDAHALDAGTRLEQAIACALRRSLGELSGRALWQLAGAPGDLVSGPALTWNLPLLPGSALDALTSAATSIGAPLHLSALLLRAAPPLPRPGSLVLIVENPRLVEAAAERRVAFGVAASNGNPSGAVVALVDALIVAGADVAYHGDFDAAGLGICGRMLARGARPHRMDADDYLRAVAAADASGVVLPTEPRTPPLTPWSPALHDAFNARRAVVHEERIIDDVFAVERS